MMNRCIILIVGILGLSASHADEYVDKADSNDDGFVTLHELRAAYFADPGFNKRIEQAFSRYDRDGDGLISEDERREARADMRSGKIDPKTAASRPSDTAQPMKAGVLASDSESGNALDSRASPRRDGVRDKVVGTVRRDESSGAGINSRNETWLREIDTDNSGGASIAELIANGDGQQWFRESEFHAADKNDDGDLDAAELAALVRSLERRQR